MSTTNSHRTLVITSKEPRTEFYAFIKVVSRKYTRACLRLTLKVKKSMMHLVSLVTVPVKIYLPVKNDYINLIQFRNFTRKLTELALASILKQ